MDITKRNKKRIFFVLFLFQKIARTLRYSTSFANFRELNRIAARSAKSVDDNFASAAMGDMFGNSFGRH